MKALFQNLKRIKEAPQKNEGYDLICIISSKGAKDYWEWRLKEGKGKIYPAKAKIFCVEEDFPKGAGQLLGTLRALQILQKNFDIFSFLKKGKTVAFYHTAGHGKRMAPLCGAEGNNKPAIKLPSPYPIEGKKNLLTLLEAVIFSTQIYAKTREGRISVFWGDQIIIPERHPKRETNLLGEIFGFKEKISLKKSLWQKEWQSYGILIPQKRGVLQREKLSFEKIKELEKKGILKKEGGKILLAKSLGIFSLDWRVFKILLKEFSDELERKERKLNTDFHFWMPLTSTQKEYQEYGGDPIYWKRIKDLKKRIQKKLKVKEILGMKNLGKESLFWDFGQIKLYYQNLLLLCKNKKESKIMREFFDLEKYFIKKKKTKKIFIKNTLFVKSKVEEGKIENSVMVYSKFKKANLKDSVLINTRAKKIKAKKNLLYNVKGGKVLSLKEKEVITDVIFGEGSRIRMRSQITKDGKKLWKVRLPENVFSFAEIEKYLSRIANDALKFRW